MHDEMIRVADAEAAHEKALFDANAQSEAAAVDIKATAKEVQLEIEVPGIDEVMWARGDVCFDILVPSATAAGGPLGLIRRTGYRIAAAAQRDLRMLRDVVVETYRARHELLLDRAIASCYARA